MIFVVLLYKLYVEVIYCEKQGEEEEGTHRKVSWKWRKCNQELSIKLFFKFVIMCQLLKNLKLLFIWDFVVHCNERGNLIFVPVFNFFGRKMDPRSVIEKHWWRFMIYAFLWKYYSTSYYLLTYKLVGMKGNLMERMLVYCYDVHLVPSQLNQNNGPLSPLIL